MIFITSNFKFHTSYFSIVLHPNSNPIRFQRRMVLAFIEHITIIALAILVCLAFGPYNMILAIVWTTFRIVEGLIQIYMDVSFWQIRVIARQYSGMSGAEQKSFSNLGRIIFQTKVSRFTLAMVFWSIGTLAYSIVFVTSGVVPLFIGWRGCCSPSCWVGE